jgi:multidrug resistance efflux pump
MNRMNGIINNKEKNIENLNAALNDEKERILNITRNNTAEVSDLVHDKNRLKEEVDHLNLELAEAREERKTFQAITDKNLNALEGAILNLKEELEISQINYIREKDKSSLIIDDLHR